MLFPNQSGPRPSYRGRDRAPGVLVPLSFSHRQTQLSTKRIGCFRCDGDLFTMARGSSLGPPPVWGDILHSVIRKTQYRFAQRAKKPRRATAFSPGPWHPASRLRSAAVAGVLSQLTPAIFMSGLPVGHLEDLPAYLALAQDVAPALANPEISAVVFAYILDRYRSFANGRL